MIKHSPLPNHESADLYIHLTSMSTSNASRHGIADGGGQSILEEKGHAMDFAGPNPDPLPEADPEQYQYKPPSSRDRDDGAPGSEPGPKRPTIPIVAANIGPPPDGGLEACLVVLGGFSLMFVSFGFSKSSPTWSANVARSSW